MELLVDRIHSDDDTTLSIVSIDAKFQCFGLEDEDRAMKIPGEKRIPSGRYKVGLRTVGGFHNRYSKKFPDFHEGMLQVLDVPGFDYILIHIGNDDDDTAGCLLVGGGARTMVRLMVTHSTDTYEILYRKVIAAAKADNLWITYLDNDA